MNNLSMSFIILPSIIFSKRSVIYKTEETEQSCYGPLYLCIFIRRDWKNWTGWKIILSGWKKDSRGRSCWEKENPLLFRSCNNVHTYMENYQKEEQPIGSFVNAYYQRHSESIKSYLEGDQFFVCDFASGSKLDPSLSFPFINKDFASQW